MDLVLPVGFEPTTIRLELFCSDPLSYRSKVDAYFGSRKATTLFQRNNSFFLEYCCYLGIQVFRLLFARGLRIPPYLRCCAYTWPCAMHRVPGRLRTCAERRLGACLCRLGYGNLAGFPSPRSTFVADINLSIPKERGKNVRGLFSSGRQSPETVSRYRARPMNRRGKRKPDTSWKLKCREYHAWLLRMLFTARAP